MGKQAKKLSLFNTLEILKKYSDEEHRLSQAEIVDLLKQYNGSDRTWVRDRIAGNDKDDPK